MSKKETSNEKTMLSRRKFMAGAGVGVMAAGAVVVARGNSQVTEMAAETQPEKSKKGYQLSEHVKTYYRTLLV